MKIRHLIREKLTATEIEKLAKSVGGVENLVAPKKRKEAAALSGKKLVAWLAEDGSRIRRPIVHHGRRVTLGFAADAQAALKAAL